MRQGRHERDGDRPEDREPDEEGCRDRRARAARRGRRERLELIPVDVARLGRGRDVPRLGRVGRQRRSGEHRRGAQRVDDRKHGVRVRRRGLGVERLPLGVARREQRADRRISGGELHRPLLHHREQPAPAKPGQWMRLAVLVRLDLGGVRVRERVERRLVLFQPRAHAAQANVGERARRVCHMDRARIEESVVVAERGGDHQPRSRDAACCTRAVVRHVRYHHCILARSALGRSLRSRGADAPIGMVQQPECKKLLSIRDDTHQP